MRLFSHRWSTSGRCLLHLQYHSLVMTSIVKVSLNLTNKHISQMLGSVRPCCLLHNYIKPAYTRYKALRVIICRLFIIRSFLLLQRDRDELCGTAYPQAKAPWRHLWTAAITVYVRVCVAVVTLTTRQSINCYSHAILVNVSKQQEFRDEEQFSLKMIFKT